VVCFGVAAYLGYRIRREGRPTSEVDAAPATAPAAPQSSAEALLDPGNSAPGGSPNA
jgi:hypothetical protein